ncbi:MAG: hypothetical protein C5B52_02990 [Bacteroidetes bacterium]|nr:MAG: hypothetical protein C5B52_02990 [Bacteroidota bacterium]
MKKILLLPVLAVACILFSCNQSAKTPTDAAPPDSSSKKEEPKAAANVVFPYTPSYSSNFEIGDPENSKKILQLWRYYEENKLSEGRSLFADTVTFRLGNGGMITGPADSLLAGATKDRSMYTSVIDSVHAFTCIKEPSKNENWVIIWAEEFRTDKKGKKTSNDMQESWLLKDGKVVYVEQFTKPSKH